MKYCNLYLIISVLVITLLSSCKKDDPNDSPFDNKVYINAVDKKTDIHLKSTIKSSTQIIRSGIAKPEAQEITITYAVIPELAATYNKAYYDEAILLSEEYYEFSTIQATIAAGSVLSTDVELCFKNLNQLSRDTVYVLPVTMVDAGSMPILERARTLYYVLKGAASINVVADLEKSNYISFPSFIEQRPSASVCNNLKQLTVETLFRVRDFQPGIQTIMGIEGYFLLRISDNGLEPNQLQISTGVCGNISNEKFLLPSNEWIHLAVTYDMDAQTLLVYKNGEVIAEKSGIVGAMPLDFGKPNVLGNHSFYIGYSYGKGRELDGEVSECRIWNIVRTQEEITESFYEVEPDAPGLVAYWKFDEGKGEIIRDHTGNGNDGKAVTSLRWTPVTLPLPDSVN